MKVTKKKDVTEVFLIEPEAQIGSCRYSIELTVKNGLLHECKLLGTDTSSAPSIKTVLIGDSAFAACGLSFAHEDERSLDNAISYMRTFVELFNRTAEVLLARTRKRSVEEAKKLLPSDSIVHQFDNFEDAKWAHDALKNVAEGEVEVKIWASGLVGVYRDR